MRHGIDWGNFEAGTYSVGRFRLGLQRSGSRGFVQQWERRRRILG